MTFLRVIDVDRLLILMGTFILRSLTQKLLVQILIQILKFSENLSIDEFAVDKEKVLI